MQRKFSKSKRFFIFHELYIEIYKYIIENI